MVQHRSATIADLFARDGVEYLAISTGETVRLDQLLEVDDFKFALRRDPRKLGRVEELLMMSKVIADARKAFDDNVEGGK